MGERPLQVVSRAYHQLTGIVPQVGPLVLMEDLYQVDEDGHAWHLSAMYYWLERPAATALSLAAVDDKNRPRLMPAVSVDINQLKFGRQALQLVLRRLKSA
jgi:ADP-ribose pyrophosphatase YjhB (NUDIX family)